MADKTQEKPSEKAAEKKPAKEVIKKGDFIEIDYIGSLDSDGTIFDTTDEGVAKKEGFYSKGQKYGPVVICVGQHNIVKGIDTNLEGKETGTEYIIDIPPEDGFGKKDVKRIQLISTTKFLKQQIQPQPGLQVTIDGMMGVIKNVSGGRTLVDFNHPLASRDLKYKIRVNRIVKDDSEKLSSLLSIMINMPKSDIRSVSISQGKAVVKTEKKMNLPKELVSMISTKANELIPAVKELEFEG